MSQSRQGGVATAEVSVAVDPNQAFHRFTAEINDWWRVGSRYWMEPERAQGLRFEPGVGGRLLEIYDDAAGDVAEVGRVTVWEPGRRLGFTWRQANWGEGEHTDVDVRFEPEAGGTRVLLEHSGWDKAPSAPPELVTGYTHGWAELLGWFAGEEAEVA